MMAAATPLVQAAREWYQRGATPMAARQKRPLAQGWPTLDPAEHLARIEADPPEQIGLLMGPQRSGRILIAIDIDADKRGEETMAMLIAELGQLPDTLTQRTGGGGFHLILEWPAELADRCPTTSTEKLGPGIDIRGERGHIVAAPSPHESGRLYELINACAPAPMPAAWAHRIIEAHRPQPPATASGEPVGPTLATDVVERCRRYVERMDPAISGSGGHQAAWRVAQVVARGFALPRPDGLAVLREFNARCQPPWSERELAHKLDSAEANSRVPLGHLLEGRRGEWRADTWRPEWDAENAHTTADPSDGASDTGNVRRGPWAGSGASQPTAPVFEFPGFSEDSEQAPDPTACVPEPEAWADDDAVPPPPSVPPAYLGKLRDVTVNAIASRVLEIIDANYEGFIYDAGRFWLYWEGRYVRLPEWWLLKAIKAYHGVKSVQQEEGNGTGMPFLASVTNLKAVQSLIAIDLAARQNMPTEGSYFDDSPALAVFRNGALVVDHSGKPSWTAHSPAHRARYRFEFDYQAGLVPQHFVAVAHDWFRGLDQSEVDTTILAIRQYAGHAVLNSLHRLKLSVALLMLGKGHDGKSTLINLLRACLPPGSTAELDPAALGAKSATVDLSRAALHGKLANLCDDCSAQPWTDTSFLKRVLDHAWVSARRIGGDPFTYRATLASVFACNELPRVSDKSFGFFRRWLLIQFPNTIPASARDPRLEQKILGLEKRELVCWFVDAALEMLHEGGPRTIAEPKCHKELLSKWAAGDDSVAGFVSGYTENAGPDKASWTPTAALYEAYAAWCKWVYGDFRAARETQSKDAFAKALPRTQGVQVGKTGKAGTRVVNRRLRRAEES